MTHRTFREEFPWRNKPNGVPPYIILRHTKTTAGEPFTTARRVEESTGGEGGLLAI